MTTTTISTDDLDMIREFVRTYIDNVIEANRLNWLQEVVAQEASPFKAEDFESLGWDLHRTLTKADCAAANGLVPEILVECLRKRASEKEAVGLLVKEAEIIHEFGTNAVLETTRDDAGWTAEEERRALENGEDMAAWHKERAPMEVWLREGLADGSEPDEDDMAALAAELGRATTKADKAELQRVMRLELDARARERENARNKLRYPTLCR